MKPYQLIALAFFVFGGICGFDIHMVFAPAPTKLEVKFDQTELDKLRAENARIRQVNLVLSTQNHLFVEALDKASRH